VRLLTSSNGNRRRLKVQVALMDGRKFESSRSTQIELEVEDNHSLDDCLEAATNAVLRLGRQDE
jgi:hypothetical protein